MRSTKSTALAAAALFLALASRSQSAPLGTAFTYQGRLDLAGAPAGGVYDLHFTLWDDPDAGAQIGVDVDAADLTLVDGTFVAQLDFGAGAFDGSARWLEISVKEDAEVDFLTLTPRQPLTPGPYSIYSATGVGADGQWTVSGFGLEYLAGNIAVGASATSDVKIYANAGTTNANAGYFANNHPSYAALGVRNDATNGLGIYDAWSDRHYLSGRLGLGTLSPVAPLHAVSSTTAAIIGQHTGNWIGVYGESQSFQGVVGKSIIGTGVAGEGGGAFNAGVYGLSTNAQGWGGYFKNTANGFALFADGKAAVRTLDVLGGADLVEGFTAGTEPVEPGTVVVIDPSRPGHLTTSARAYDHRVAGVVSGAGGVQPGLRLGQNGVLDGETPVAMTGRVYVRASAENGPIAPGDLLTTAGSAGHAMRASDPARSQGAVIGKAMTPLADGTGLVLVLVNLQ